MTTRDVAVCKPAPCPASFCVRGLPPSGDSLVDLLLLDALFWRFALDTGLGAHEARERECLAHGSAGASPHPAHLTGLSSRHGPLSSAISAREALNVWSRTVSDCTSAQTRAACKLRYNGLAWGGLGRPPAPALVFPVRASRKVAVSLLPCKLARETRLCLVVFCRDSRGTFFEGKSLLTEETILTRVPGRSIFFCKRYKRLRLMHPGAQFDVGSGFGICRTKFPLNDNNLPDDRQPREPF